MLADLGLWAYAALHLLSSTAHPAELIVGAAFAVTALLALVVAAHLAAGRPVATATSVRRLRVALRRRAGRLPRLVDPDAAGRPRPRAPGTGLPAA